MTNTLAGFVRPAHAGLEEYLLKIPSLPRMAEPGPLVLTPLPKDPETTLLPERVVAEKYVWQVNQGGGPKDAYPAYMPMRMRDAAGAGVIALSQRIRTSDELFYDETQAQASPRDRLWGRYCAAYLFDAFVPRRRVKIRLDLSEDTSAPSVHEFELTGRDWLLALAPLMMPFASFIANSTAIVDPLLSDGADAVRERRRALVANGLDPFLVESMKCPPLNRNHPVIYSLVLGFREASEGEKTALFAEIRNAASSKDISVTLGPRIVAGAERALDPDFLRYDTHVAEGLLVAIAAGLVEIDFENERVDLGERGKVLHPLATCHPGFAEFRQKELGAVLRQAATPIPAASDGHLLSAELWIMSFFETLKAEMQTLEIPC